MAKNYVDLGLSVKWATCNVGAENPEDYGDYYAWGETEMKRQYDWITYKFRRSGDSDKNVTYNKYNNYSLAGIVDNKSLLDTSDDVAHVKWGGSWRMPTVQELRELVESCSFEITTINGIKGFKMSSRVIGFAGRSIFLPAAGYCEGSLICNNGIMCKLWSNCGSCDTAYGLHLYERPSVFNSFRRKGFTIRPVCP